MASSSIKKSKSLNSDGQANSKDVDPELEINLNKLHTNTKEFNTRHYKLDPEKHQIIASTKQFMKKEKIYHFSQINEVKSGCNSDKFKAFFSKHKNDKKNPQNMEELSIVISYDNFKKTLNLTASDIAEKERWIKILSQYINEHKKGTGMVKDNIKAYFKLADKTSDKTISKKEVQDFLDSMNVKIEKNQLEKLIDEADTNKDGQLNEEEFKKFFDLLYKRKEILSLFALIQSLGEKQKLTKLPEFVTLDKFIKFIDLYQKESKSEQECKDLIIKYEPNDCKKDFKFTTIGFVDYLNDIPQFIEDDKKIVYMNMNLPISHYFVNSSHNTYLSGGQITSESRPQSYIAAIMRGARLLEMDCHDGSDGQPRIFHKKTFTTKILFEDVLIAVKEYAFKLTDFPLILTIELHCTPPQQNVMASLIVKHLKDYLYVDEFNDDTFPTLNQLKRKILIRCQKPKKNNETIKKLPKSPKSKTIKRQESDDSQLEDEENDEYYNLDKSDLGDLINVIQGASFKGIKYALDNYKKQHSSSISENKCNKLIQSEPLENIIEYTANFLTKVYPAFFRQDSSNLNPVDYWNLGFQIAALNFQTDDLAMHLNEALFSDNGECGYVIKPEILTNPSLGFNPNNIETMHNKKTFEIKVISAQKLPRGEDIVKDISDPYVKINIYGVPADVAEKKTNVVNDNGLNPIWNENFIFNINCPELAFVKFSVHDDDVGRDQLIGHYTIRFERIRQGYRHIKLKNKESKGTLFVGIKIY